MADQATEKPKKPEIKLPKPFYARWSFYVILVAVIVVYGLTIRIVNPPLDKLSEVGKMAGILEELFQPDLFDPNVKVDQATVPFIYRPYREGDFEKIAASLAVNRQAAAAAVVAADVPSPVEGEIEAVPAADVADQAAEPDPPALESEAGVVPGTDISNAAADVTSEAFMLLDKYAANPGDTVRVIGGRWGARNEKGTLKFVRIKPTLQSGESRNDPPLVIDTELQEIELVDGTFDVTFTVPPMQGDDAPVGSENVIRFELEQNDEVTSTTEVPFIVPSALGSVLEQVEVRDEENRRVKRLQGTDVSMRATAYEGVLGQEITITGQGLPAGSTGRVIWENASGIKPILDVKLAAEFREAKRRAQLFGEGVRGDGYLATLPTVARRVLEPLLTADITLQTPIDGEAVLNALVDEVPTEEIAQMLGKDDVDELNEDIIEEEQDRAEDAEGDEFDEGRFLRDMTDARVKRLAAQEVIKQDADQIFGDPTLSNKEMRDPELLRGDDPAKENLTLIRTVAISPDTEFEFQFPLTSDQNPDGLLQQIRVRVESPADGLSWKWSKTTEIVVSKMIETIFLALLATTLGVIAALPLSFLGARNIMTGTFVGKIIYFLTRLIVNIIRSIETLILVLVFVAWVGIGPFAGVLALAVSGLASLAKLYSEQIEEIDPGPIEAIQTTGANGFQSIVYAVLPQVVPSFLAFTIYRWDIDIRMSTVIGLVGGGGIGEILLQWIEKGNYSEAGVAILAIIIVVSIMDFASAYIRKKLT